MMVNTRGVENENLFLDGQGEGGTVVMCIMYFLCEILTVLEM